MAGKLQCYLHNIRTLVVLVKGPRTVGKTHQQAAELIISYTQSSGNLSSPKISRLLPQ